MKPIQKLFIVATACVVMLPCLLARPVPQIEADIRQVKAEIQKCAVGIGALEKMISETEADKYSDVTIGQLQLAKDQLGYYQTCMAQLQGRLASLKKELTAAPTGPNSPEARTKHRGLDDLARLHGEVAAALARLTETSARIRTMEAASRQKRRR